MKDYVIFSKGESEPVIISSRSGLYLEYLDSGYVVTYQGNKKDCEVEKENFISLLADID